MLKRSLSIIHNSTSIIFNLLSHFLLLFRCFSLASNHSRKHLWYMKSGPCSYELDREIERSPYFIKST